uniref:Joining chain of multimeric IgA and IgM n=1 Tax=Bos taurus TaxID=9913 RepID=A0AAA9RYV6_BOVIN
ISRPARLCCPQDFSGKNSRVGCHFFLQGIFPTKGLNPCLLRFLHCRWILYRIIPSAEDPSQDIVERNVRIIVPLNSRENISDPTSPMRTKFVYHLSDLCKKCDTTEVELEDQVVTASQSNICDSDAETCYTYDRNKCYTNRVKLSYRGQTKMVETALTPDSCYPD